MKVDWKSPYAPMAVAGLMYVFKAASKFAAGWYVHSSMFLGDASHNLADLVQVAMVCLVLFAARKKPSAEYPFGRKKLESLGEAAIGVSLGVLALQLVGTSVAGLLAAFRAPDAWRALWPAAAPEPIHLGWPYAAVAAAVMAVNAAVSIAVGRYEIRVGRATGHTSVVADGEETVSDARVETVAFLGVVCETLFHAAWLEYVFTLGVVFLIGHTAWELASRAYESLLQKSVGTEHERAVAEAVADSRGVVRVQDLKTFRSGATAVCILAVETRVSPEAERDLRFALEAKIRAVIEKAGFDGADCYVRFVRPNPGHHRFAVLVRYVERGLEAATVLEAQAVLVCDVEDGVVVRQKESPFPPSMDDFLAKKRAHVLWTFPGAADKVLHLVDPAGVKNESLPTRSLAPLGIR